MRSPPVAAAKRKGNREGNGLVWAPLQLLLQPAFFRPAVCPTRDAAPNKSARSLLWWSPRYLRSAERSRLG